MKIGEYDVIRELGEGGMGKVFLAIQPVTRRHVAVKTIATESTDAEYRERFLREARAAAKIEHHRIVAIYEASTDDAGNLFMAMEYVDGGSLQDLLDSTDDRFLAPAAAMEIITAAAEGLAVAEQYQLVHRDIKPDNILISKLTGAKLADLGIARHLEGEHSATLTGTSVAMGTPRYISPEQAMNARTADIRSDIYSLGATFYELVTGKPPFDGETGMEIMMAHIQTPLPHPKSIRNDLPDGICAVICKMLEKNPDNRYQNTGDLLHDLHIVVAPAADLGALKASVIEDSLAKAVPAKKVQKKGKPSPKMKVQKAKPRAPEQRQRDVQIAQGKARIDAKQKKVTRLLHVVIALLAIGALYLIVHRNSTREDKGGPVAGPPWTGPEQPMDADEWGMMCWSGKEWQFKDMNSTRHEFHADRLEVTNTTGIHRIAVPTYRQVLPHEFDLEIDAKGGVEVSLMAGDGSDRNFHVKTITDGDWHNYRFRRTAGKIDVWIDNKQKPLLCHNCAGLGAVRFGVSVGSNRKLELRGFRLEPDTRVIPSHPGTQDAEVVYLSDLGPVHVATYNVDNWGFGNKGFVGNGETRISVNGEESPHGLGVHAPSNGASRVAYALDGHYSRFLGEGALNDPAAASTPLTFQILGDGKKLWTSKPVKVAGIIQAFDVDVTGVDRLELLVHCPGPNHAAAAVWVEPRLLAPGAAPQRVPMPKNNNDDGLRARLLAQPWIFSWGGSNSGIGSSMRKVEFLPDGKIGEGRTKADAAWRIRDGKLSINGEDGRADIRLEWSARTARWESNKDTDVLYKSGVCHLIPVARTALGQDTRVMPSHPGTQDAEVVYLSDLGPTTVQTFTDGGWGFGNKGFTGGREGRIIVNGKASPHGLGTHPPSNGRAHLRYALDSGYRRFMGEVALNDSSPGSRTPLTFQIVGDGKKLWTSTRVKAAKVLQAFDVNVTGVDKLELLVHCRGHLHAAHAVWLEPRLISVGQDSVPPPRGGLILHYDFGQKGTSVEDKSGNGNKGEVNGSIWKKDGLRSGMYSFDGLPGLATRPDTSADSNHDYVYVGSSPSGFPLDEFTISVVCTPQNEGALIGSGQNELWQRDWYLTHKYFTWAWKPGDSSGAVGRESRKLTFSGKTGKRQHIVLTRTKGTIKIYLDGKEVASGDGFPEQALPVYSYGLYVGTVKIDRGRWLRWHCYRGDIHNIMVWNRCLSDSEVRSVSRQHR
jgi:hypothetical protein